jgi:hypothetical protein
MFLESRWTDFCQSFDWDGAKTSNAQLCPEHNDADWSGNPPPLVAIFPFQIIGLPARQKPQ